jgi:vitamin B12/bleomycin/antimicrobial peptide transport system ATP-binding/permease protein
LWTSSAFLRRTRVTWPQARRADLVLACCREQSLKKMASTIAMIWRLSIPYFRSEERWPGLILLTTVIATELALVALNVILNLWYNFFYNALQDHNWNAFVNAILFFFVLGIIYVVIAVYRTYVTQWLQIRWRRWMTQNYLQKWLQAANHYHMQLLGDAADNPDQRIAEDVKSFVEFSLSIVIGILGSVVSFCSFVVILWHLSNEAPLHLFGFQLAIPGYLVWAALIYAVLGTALIHLIGWRLVPLNFQQQRYEADFRFNLVRTRENSEQIAALGGDTTERDEHLIRFQPVIANWWAIMRRTKLVNFFAQGYSQVSSIFPYIMVSPAYFAGAMQLGGMMQTGSAFDSVQKALSYFISNYQSIAEWRAMMDRLVGFERAIEGSRTAALASPTIDVERQRDVAFSVDQLEVRLPSGEPIVAVDQIEFAPGDRVLITGPSGSGKSTMFRAMTGIWPFGSGRVQIPADAKIMLVPQRPYFPVAPLAAAVSYPAKAGTYDDTRVAEALRAVGLSELLPRLHDEEHWNRILSLGEQQRLAIARALLHAPDYLLLDESTASLDEAAETSLYRLLLERLHGATIVSIGHRSTLRAFHARRIELVEDAASFRLREVPLAPAAE